MIAAKKKVCHITTVHPAKDVRIFYKECVSLANAGFDVTLLVLNGMSDQLNGVKIIGIQHPFTGRIDRIRNAPQIALQAALKINADIYHFHDPEFLRVALQLKKTGKKVIYDVHEDVPRQILAKYWIPPVLRQLTSFLFEKFENHVAARLDYIVTATPFIKNRFLAINNNTIDINNYPILDDFDLTLSPSFDSQSVCYIGGIEKVRGIVELVEAIDNTSMHLTLAGSFSDKALEIKMKQHRAWRHVDFKGFVDRKEITSILKHAMAGMVTLHPIINYVDALPVKMFEYMAAGIPVIASNFPLWKEIIERHQCGIVVNPLNPDEIKNAMQLFIHDRAGAMRAGENGRRAVIDKYNWQIEAKKLITIYQQI